MARRYSRSAATFALLAGVSLALITGGRQPVWGRTRTAAKLLVLRESRKLEITVPITRSTRTTRSR